ncbi:acyl-CoA-like ligand-binding transcription factor [Streptosporangium sp. NBC_01756]|uniref:acyl-CoA-like ligand-binding transcription factor n=1 Tax=Streptosporangium sp. NBC_01756 TaxID=2975950 RepID=UPI002DDA4AB5|nr:TetR family transcriptional regulator [Streptosporangium sp. NBC_01756]WSC89301.1 TetR family transcriptional regulator [Streptosporangium sp. NBC_01756]
MSSSPRAEGLRERKKAKTRRTIQEHALRLFAEQGYEATTVEQIAEAAEISPSTFFRYFPTKEDVAVQDAYDPALAAALAAQPADLTPVAAVRATVSAVLEGFPEDEESQVLTRTRLQLKHTALRARAVDSMTTTIGMLAEGIAGRLGRDITDPLSRATAGAVAGVLLAAVFAWAEADGARRLADVTDEALGLLEAGLRP